MICSKLAVLNGISPDLARAEQFAAAQFQVFFDEKRNRQGFRASTVGVSAQFRQGFAGQHHAETLFAPNSRAPAYLEELDQVKTYDRLDQHERAIVQIDSDLDRPLKLLR